MLSYAMVFCTLLFFCILSTVFCLSVFYSKTRPYIYLVIILKWKEKEHRWPRKLDLALMTNYPLLCGLLLARCQYLHRSNIVWVGHPTRFFIHDFLSNTRYMRHCRPLRCIYRNHKQWATQRFHLGCHRHVAISNIHCSSSNSFLRKSRKLRPSSGYMYGK